MPINQNSTQLKIVARGSSEDYAWIEVAIVGTSLTVGAALAQLLVERFPTLPNHACKSSGSDTVRQTFGDHLIGALLPHAAEHIAIELLVAQHPGESFAGNSSWISREKQIMRVRVSLPSRGTDAAANKTPPDNLPQPAAPASHQPSATLQQALAASSRALSEAIELLNQLIPLSQRQNR